MKVSIEGQGHFLALVQGYLHIKLKLAFLRNQWAIFNQNAYVIFLVQGNENKHDAGHMIKMAAMPIYYINTYLVTRNQCVDFDETWYEASEIKAHYILFK